MKKMKQKISRKSKILIAIATMALIPIGMVVAQSLLFFQTSNTITIASDLIATSVSISFDQPIGFGNTGNPTMSGSACTSTSATIWNCPQSQIAAQEYPSDYVTYFFVIQSERATPTILNATYTPTPISGTISTSEEYTTSLMNAQSQCIGTASSTNSNPSISTGMPTFSASGQCIDLFITYTLSATATAQPTFTINQQIIA